MICVVPAKAGTQGRALQMIQKRPCVYVLVSRRNGTLYIAVTSDLMLRKWQHRSNAVAGVKGLTVMTNSRYNGWRFEDVWLDR